MHDVDPYTRDLPNIKRDVEALLFAAGEPLSVAVITGALASPDAPPPELAEKVEGALRALAAEFPPGGERGFELVQVAGEWVFRTNPRCERAVSSLFELPSEATRLSPASMEVLTIIAYLQPVSRPQITEIRGVNSDSPVHTLLERDLIAEVGRYQGAGSAVLYGTTRRFEVMFGLNGLADLPALEGFELDDAHKEELRRRLGVLATPS